MHGATSTFVIHDVELLEDGYPRRGLPPSLEAEAAAFQLEELILLAAHERHDSEAGVLDAALVLVVLVAAAVEEGILLPRMAMQVAEE